MPESPLAPTAERRPAWRAAALAYRQARREGASHDKAMDAAEASLRERWPELTAEVASAAALAVGHGEDAAGRSRTIRATSDQCEIGRLRSRPTIVVTSS